MKPKNKRGQQFMIGILMMVMCLAIFIATIPMLTSVFNISRQSDGLNCKGYTHPSDTTKSYNASLRTESLSCTVMDLGIPYIVLAVLFGLVTRLIYGKLTEEPQSYGGGY